MYRFILIATLSGVLFSCCTAGKNSEIQTQPASSEIVMVEETELAPAALPIELDLRGETLEDSLEVTIRIAYKVGVHADTHLKIVPGEGTELLEGAAEMTFASPQQAGVVVKKVRIGGTNPSIEVLASVMGVGFAAETHGHFPPAKVTQRNEVALQPLPAPIEVEGAVIDSGVEVRP
ncbi:MAG: hypothetical protein J6A01_06865 [Proteobacteria bacterium]|nr:hypothetical protein [Pseudomonadota bacterium]